MGMEKYLVILRCHYICPISMPMCLNFYKQHWRWCLFWSGGGGGAGGIQGVQIKKASGQDWDFAWVFDFLWLAIGQKINFIQEKNYLEKCP